MQAGTVLGQDTTSTRCSFVILSLPDISQSRLSDRATPFVCIQTMALARQTVSPLEDADRRGRMVEVLPQSVHFIPFPNLRLLPPNTRPVAAIGTRNLSNGHVLAIVTPFGAILSEFGLLPDDMIGRDPDAARRYAETQTRRVIGECENHYFFFHRQPVKAVVSAPGIDGRPEFTCQLDQIVRTLTERGINAQVKLFRDAAVRGGVARLCDLGQGSVFVDGMQDPVAIYMGNEMVSGYPGQQP
ncbi:uncharacterized protein DSM5745_08623 [Aspergillus mulundensis]|uniref:Uncharacterized protein n=1 Tax=Aspergillus mulundensis TaxID=1810919 RepID=A0A3D8R475_9EURO|nr:hypothetical protein DSM5745_08623 [Aspergillus mulundensis]RDW68863.1 hypothetical protein DSM5745_08623 [Aspergillus mulundensis]